MARGTRRVAGGAAVTSVDAPAPGAFILGAGTRTVWPWNPAGLRSDGLSRGRRIGRIPPTNLQRERQRPRGRYGPRNQLPRPPGGPARPGSLGFCPARHTRNTRRTASGRPGVTPARERLFGCTPGPATTELSRCGARKGWGPEHQRPPRPFLGELCEVTLPLGDVALDASFLHDGVSIHHGAASAVGEKLLQNSSDRTRPRAPATIRMIPTVWMLNPEVVTSTARP
jgi:hypothetical protein